MVYTTRRCGYFFGKTITFLISIMNGTIGVYKSMRMTSTRVYDGRVYVIDRIQRYDALAAFEVFVLFSFPFILCPVDVEENAEYSRTLSKHGTDDVDNERVTVSVLEHWRLKLGSGS